MEKTLREAAEALNVPFTEYMNKHGRYMPSELSDICEAWKDLRAALDREADDGWISVEDRLPTWGERVAVWTGECVAVASRWNVPNRGWQWEWPDGKKAHVTHWQPLPEPPQSRERGA